MSGAPSKADREKCWASRDELWSCLDKHEDNDKCKKQREIFEASCSKQWVCVQ